MNRLQQMAVGCFVFCALVGGLWLSKGMHMATPQQIETITEETILGDVVKTSEWVANPDMLDIGLDIAGPIIGLFGALGLGLLWKGRKA